MNRSRSTLSLLAAALFTLTALAAIAEPAKVGDRLPTTDLQTDKGEAFDLAAAVKEKPAVIIFYRGSWCPYCTKHLSGLAEIEDDLLAAGYQLIAISPDQPSVLRAKAEYQAYEYQLLSDRKARTAEAFGIVFQVPAKLVSKYKNEYKIDLEAASGETHHLLPHPAVFIVDSKGTIQFAHVNENYRERLDPAKVLAAAK